MGEGEPDRRHTNFFETRKTEGSSREAEGAQSETRRFLSFIRGRLKNDEESDERGVPLCKEEREGIRECSRETLIGQDTVRLIM